MRRPWWIAIVAAAVLAGCDGDEEASEPVAVPADVAREVTAAFDDYTAAMGREDYERACTHLAPESIERMRRDVTKADQNAPDDCAGMLQRVNETAEAEEQRQIEEIARTAEVEGVFEADPPKEGTALIAWAAEVDGKRVPIQQGARLVDGEWKLVGGGVR